MAVYEQILDRALSQVQTLALLGIVSNAKIAKLPAVEEEIDTLPLGLVVPSDEKEVVTRCDFERGMAVKYHFDVCFITKGKKLLAETGNTDPNDNLYRQLDWRQISRNLFFNPLVFLGIAGITGTSIFPGEPVDRRYVNQNYDYSIITVQVRTREQGIEVAGENPVWLIGLMPDKNYVHQQTVASDTWTVNHNLNKKCSVTVVDDAWELVQCEVEFIDDNNVILRFSTPQTGQAFFN